MSRVLDLPAGWERAKLGEVARNVNITERDPLKNALEHFIGLEHIDPESLHIARWGTIKEGTSFQRKFTKGQILLGKRRAYQHKVAVADFDGLCSSDILALEPKGDKLVPALLPFVVQDSRFFDFAVRTSSGSLSPRTKWKYLAEYEIALPPRVEQDRIAEILWAMEDCLIAYEKIMLEAEILRKTIMKELLSKGIQHTRFKYSEVLHTEIPEDWKIVRLSGLLSLEYGIGLPERKRSGKGYPVYGSNGIVGYHNQFIVDGIGIVVGRKGTVGSVHLAKTGFWPIDTAYYVKIKGDLSIYWVYYLLLSLGLHQLHSSTAVPGLNRNDVCNLLVAVPPKSEQKIIADTLLKVDEVIERTKENVAAAKALKMILISHLFAKGVIA